MGYPGHVFGVRDLVYALLVCALLIVALDCRPSRSARSWIEREAEAGFVAAYAGHRWAADNSSIGGDRATGGAGLPRVQAQQLEILGQRMNWSGSRGRFVVRHVVELEEDEDDASRELYVEIERRDGQWRYTRAELRGEGPLATSRNPFQQALRTGRDEDD